MCELRCANLQHRAELPCADDTDLDRLPRALELGKLGGETGHDADGVASVVVTVAGVADD